MHSDIDYKKRNAELLKELGKLKDENNGWRLANERSMLERSRLPVHIEKALSGEVEETSPLRDALKKVAVMAAELESYRAAYYKQERCQCGDDEACRWALQSERAA